MQLVLSRLAFEQDPDAFVAGCAAETEALRAKLAAARDRLPAVTADRSLLLQVSEMCALLNVDGLRGDITVSRAARALAALEGAPAVTQAHVARVAGMCLSHRLRKDPMDSLDNGSKVRAAFRRVFGADLASSGPVVSKKAPPPGGGQAAAAAKAQPQPAGGAKPGAAAAPGAAAGGKPADKPKAGAWGGLGR